MSKRPEHELPPELYYNDKEALKYSNNTHIQNVQEAISKRAIELLALGEDEKCVILDIGCGSGLSGDVLTEAGHDWIGVDISSAMLDIALDREVSGDLILQDIGDGLPFRGASFDNAISISAIQWLCHSNTSSQNPVNRLRRFFSSLFACLTKNGRAVLQFYPDSPEQGRLIQMEAMRAGFSGGVLIDFPNSTRAKKYFLVLNVSPKRQMPDALDETANESEIIKGKNEVASTSSRETRKRKISKDSAAWIKSKKERAKRQNKEVPTDSKYTGRKRKPRF